MEGKGARRKDTYFILKNLKTWAIVIHPLNKYLLSIYYVPSIVFRVPDTAVNKTDKSPLELVFKWVESLIVSPPTLAPALSSLVAKAGPVPGHITGQEGLCLT